MDTTDRPCAAGAARFRLAQPYQLLRRKTGKQIRFPVSLLCISEATLAGCLRKWDHFSRTGAMQRLDESGQKERAAGGRLAS
jgi:hypothetical protein